MSILISAFVLGVVCGLRVMVGFAAVSWAAYLQQVPLEGTWLSFLGFRFTGLYVGERLRRWIVFASVCSRRRDRKSVV